MPRDQGQAGSGHIVTQGGLADAEPLLAAELDVHEAAHTDANDATQGGAWPMSRWLKWALAGMVVVAGGLFFIQRNKRTRMGGAA